MRKYDIGYYSSADRGLETLLKLIPKVEEKLGRKVTSCWAYGWQTFDHFHRSNPEKMKWKWQIIRAMNEVGMESKGRLSHQELAALMKDTNVWAYPTAFDEIHCITALKAQAAGCKVVTSGHAALQETVYYDEPQVDDIDTNEEAQNAFVDRLVAAIREPRDESTLTELAERVKNENDWSEVAKKWDKVLSE